MAMRSLLRRIPGTVALSPSGARLGPVHGISPAAASRFMCTRSEGEYRTIAELYKDPENVPRLRKELHERQKAAWRSLEEYKRTADRFRKFAHAGTAVYAAIPVLVLMILESNNQA